MRGKCPSAEPLFESLEPRQLLFAISWDGGGGDNDWHNPLNWYGDILPGPDDDVFLSIAGTPVISITQDVTVRSISSVEAVHLSAGIVSVETQWKQSAWLGISGGELAGAGNLALGGEAMWTGGTLGGTGKFQILAGAELSIGGNVTLARELVNNGELTWLSGNIAAHSARIYNLKDRTFLINSGGTLSAESGESLLINGGTVAVATGIGMTTIIEITLNNHARPVQIPIFIVPFGTPSYFNTLAAGIVDVRSGTLALTGDVLQKEGHILRGGEWWVTSSHAELLLPGPTLLSVINSSGSATKIIMRGQGSSFPQIATAAIITSLTLEDRAFPIFAGVSITNLTIDSPGTITTVPGLYLTTDLLDLRGGVLVVNDYNADRTLIAAGAELHINGDWLISGTFFGGGGDSVEGGGLLRLAGTLTFSSGSIEVTTFLITPGGTLRVMGDTSALSQRLITSRIINYGTIDWSGIDTWRIHSELVNRGLFNIRAHGFVETSAGTSPQFAPATFHNFGAVQVLDGASVTFRGAGGGVRFVNHGTAHITDGRLNLFGGVESMRSALSVAANWTIAESSELAIGGLAASFRYARIDGPGLIRIGTHFRFERGIITGLGDMFIGPTGRLELVSPQPGLTTYGNSILRTITTNHGIIDVENTAEIRGAIRNYGTLALDGGLETDRLVPFPSSTLRIRSTGDKQHGGLTVVHGGYFRGTLHVDFAWQPAAGYTFPIYLAYIFNKPGPPFAEFDQITATGLAPGRGVTFHTHPGQQTTAQGIITVT